MSQTYSHVPIFVLTKAMLILVDHNQLSNKHELLRDMYASFLLSIQNTNFGRFLYRMVLHQMEFHLGN